MSTQTFSEAHAAQVEFQHGLMVKEIKRLTREINSAMAQKDYGRVAHLTQRLDTYVSLRSW